MAAAQIGAEVAGPLRSQPRPGHRQAVRLAGHLAQGHGAVVTRKAEPGPTSTWSPSTPPNSPG